MNAPMNAPMPDAAHRPLIGPPTDTLAGPIKSPVSPVSPVSPRRFDLVGLGECMVELHASVPLSRATALTRGYGGDVLNALVAAARLGARTGFITRVGDDPFGAGLLRGWRDEGIDTGAAPLVAGHNGVYFISLDAAGEREFSYRRHASAASTLAPEQLDPAYLASARCLLLSGITQAISASAQAATLRAAVIARAHGVLVAYDPNYRPALWAARGGLAAAQAALHELLPYIDWLLPSFPADQVLLDQPASEPAIGALAWAPMTGSLANGAQVAQKCGSDGCHLAGAGQVRHIPTTAVPHVIDTTGAGDTWNGAFLQRLLQGREPAGAAADAHVAAAYKLAHHGAIPPSLITRSSMTSRLTPQPAFDTALRQALAQIDHLLPAFSTIYPGDTTAQQFYAARDLPPFAPGANVGWTSGFWPGLLWLAYEAGDQPRFRDAAQAHLPSFHARLAARIDVDHHDLGFLYIPTCIAAYKLTGDLQAKASALDAADCLMTRYLPKAGIIQAWGDLHDPQQRGRIIIDCLMNLPLLHWASDTSGDPRYREAAVSHLERSQRYLVRADDSSFHTFHFDADSGAPLYGSTHQGYSDQSSWARGQAWGVYGFALNHKRAPELGLLATAMRQADYFLAHLPADRIAYWDLAFQSGDEPRDSSASAIAVCGLLELAEQLPDSAPRQHYLEQATLILHALIEHCGGALPHTSGLLQHGVYHKRGNQGIDEANLWGDYYYLEALLRFTRNWKPYC